MFPSPLACSTYATGSAAGVCWTTLGCLAASETICRAELLMMELCLQVQTANLGASDSEKVVSLKEERRSVRAIHRDYCVDRISIPDPAIGSAYAASFASTARLHRILFGLDAVNRAGATSVRIVDNGERPTFGARLNVNQLTSASDAFIRLCNCWVRKN
jgi:hypothetical protein